MAPAYLNFLGRPVPSVITVHNLAYQGIFPPSTVPRLGLPAESFSIQGVEYYGNLSFLKAGLYYADRITTVSPTYAEEIQRAEQQGAGQFGELVHVWFSFCWSGYWGTAVEHSDQETVAAVDATSAAVSAWILRA